MCVAFFMRNVCLYYAFFVWLECCFCFELFIVLGVCFFSFCEMYFLYCVTVCDVVILYNIFLHDLCDVVVVLIELFVVIFLIL